jgi:G3E family GTPase
MTRCVDDPMNQSPIPVSVLTGYLGAGKTTLLNHILTNRQGWKVAVIENEFGEIGVDNDLVLATQEDLIVFNNGCVCCKIRGDLIKTLSEIARRPERFDAILIETTGLADPSPVIQSFFVDEDLKALVRLDAVITLVDAKHIGLHLGSSQEAREQIAYGDVVLLNKTDLVTDADLDVLEREVRALNTLARIHRTKDAVIDLSKVLEVGAFDLSKRLEAAPDLLTEEHHEHESDIGSVSLRVDGALDGKKLNAWLGTLLKTRGTDIFRMKGIVNVQGETRRVVFQGVHMMFEGRPDRPWQEGDDRTNRIVFIGRALEAAALEAALRSCRV